jgi:murein DD-endopeptidase MepM/ murein hydrolase activator NlpD
VSLTSNFGVRNDPFNGRHRMHQGIDIPGPIGTPIYATADGVVERAQWVNGYGNLVELSHGNGLQTRYGHMSKLIAQPNQRVRRGQLIGLMGSTGRSTGSHLHYEVRIAGNAVNPMPYLEGTNYEIALADARAARSGDQQIAMGGPEARRSSDNGK